MSTLWLPSPSAQSRHPLLQRPQGHGKGEKKPLGCPPPRKTMAPSLPLSHHFTLESPGPHGPFISPGTHMDTFWKAVPFSWLVKKEISRGPYTELLTTRRSSTRRAGNPEGRDKDRKPRDELALVLGPAGRGGEDAHCPGLRPHTGAGFRASLVVLKEAHLPDVVRETPELSGSSGGGPLGGGRERTGGGGGRGT